MEAAEFCQYLNDERIEYQMEGDRIVILGIKGSALIYTIRVGVSSIPDNVTFRNNGNVELPYVEELPPNTRFENSQFVDIDSVKTIPASVVFENSQWVYVKRVEKWDAVDAGLRNRNLYCVLQRGVLKVRLGCFWGTEETTIEAIKANPSYHASSQKDYIKKVRSAFAKARKRYGIKK